jgi:outer membrane protein assembly factor BamB
MQQSTAQASPGLPPARRDPGAAQAAPLAASSLSSCAIRRALPQLLAARALRCAGPALRRETPFSDGSFGGVTVANGVVFATTIDGMLYALRAKDGHILWMDKMGGSAAGGISIADGMIYVGNGWEWTPSGSLKGGLIAYGLP